MGKKVVGIKDQPLLKLENSVKHPATFSAVLTQSSKITDWLAMKDDISFLCVCVCSYMYMCTQRVYADARAYLHVCMWR